MGENVCISSRNVDALGMSKSKTNSYFCQTSIEDVVKSFQWQNAQVSAAETRSNQCRENICSSSAVTYCRSWVGISPFLATVIDFVTGHFSRSFFSLKNSTTQFVGHNSLHLSIAPDNQVPRVSSHFVTIMVSLFSIFVPREAQQQNRFGNKLWRAGGGMQQEHFYSFKRPNRYFQKKWF